MIQHIAIPAQNPDRVAQVLAELTQGRAYPFPAPQSYIVFIKDNNQNICIKIYPLETEIIPGTDNQQARVLYKNKPFQIGDFGAAPRQANSFHAAISVPLNQFQIQAIARRENWRMVLAQRGGGAYSIIEFWLENSLLIEILTPDMIEKYNAFFTPENWEKFFEIELCFNPNSKNFAYRSRLSQFAS